MPEYLIRLVHVHETFRKPEIEALAVLAGVTLEFLYYDSLSPFCIVTLPDAASARTLITRSILSYGIWELWGNGTDYTGLYKSITTTLEADPSKIVPYRQCSFRFHIDSFQFKRSPANQRTLIESFKFLNLEGPIRMQGAELELCVFEDFAVKAEQPHKLWLGRFVAGSDRDAILKYDLKRRVYISRTSMDAELSLVTANMALASPGKLVYDPFVGTGSFVISCAHFGASTLGSDIDGRAVRGVAGVDIRSNYVQYGIESRLLDNFIADLTNTPLRESRVLHAIVCDPPYGIREGPKVLGNKIGKPAQLVMIDGKPAHSQPDYIAPKRPYGFDDMMIDVLEFSFSMLVDGGRLCMWMPTANDEDIELAIPTHPGLRLISVCVQHFNKWSRRLLTYSRIPTAELPVQLAYTRRERAAGGKADDLNRFRKKYFEGFKNPGTESAVS